MKLGKIINGEIILVEVEDGKEIGGQRSEAELYNEGYKKACENPDGGEWKEYPTCLVQEKTEENE